MSDKIIFDLSWIRNKAKKGAYYFSFHGDQERQNDNLTIAEVEEALNKCIVLEEYEDTGREKAAWLQASPIKENRSMLFVVNLKKIW